MSRGIQPAHNTSFPGLLILACYYSTSRRLVSSRLPSMLVLQSIRRQHSSAYLYTFSRRSLVDITVDAEALIYSPMAFPCLPVCHNHCSLCSQLSLVTGIPTIHAIHAILCSPNHCHIQVFDLPTDVCPFSTHVYLSTYVRRTTFICMLPVILSLFEIKRFLRPAFHQPVFEADPTRDKYPQNLDRDS